MDQGDKAGAIDQGLGLPDVIEASAIQLVHLSHESEAVLASKLSSALGPILPLPLAGSWLKSVADWIPMNPLSPEQGMWRAKPHLVEKYGLQKELSPQHTGQFPFPAGMPGPATSMHAAGSSHMVPPVSGTAAAAAAAAPFHNQPPPALLPQLLLQQQQHISPALAAAAASMAASMQGAAAAFPRPFGAPASAPPPLKHFDLMELIGDTSQGVSIEQANILQRAIRSLRDAQLASSLGALAAMAPTQLQELLSTQGVNIRDVLAKLVKHIDPAKARDHFGSGYYYGPKLPMPFMPPNSRNPVGAMMSNLAGNPAAMAAAMAAAAQQQLRMQQQQGAGGNNAAAGAAAAMVAAFAAAAAQHQQNTFPPTGASNPSFPLGGATGGAFPRPALPGAGAGSTAGKSSVWVEETVQETMMRLPPGSVKAAIFEIVVAAGRKGISVANICAQLNQRGINPWADSRSAKASIASTCTHEQALAKLPSSAGGGFVARALLPPGEQPEEVFMAQRQAQAAAQMGQGHHHHLLSLQQQQQRQRQAQAAAGGMGTGPPAGSMMALMTGAGLDRSGPGATFPAAGEGALVHLEDDPPEPSGPPPMAREVYLKNSLKCAKCFKTYEGDYSPLCLCDFCPRSYHMACLATDGGISYPALSVGSWACPKCEQRHKRRLEGSPDLPVEGDPESSFEALGEMHPDWETMDKNERRYWEKLERERRLAEDQDAKDRQYLLQHGHPRPSSNTAAIEADGVAAAPVEPGAMAHHGQSPAVTATASLPPRKHAASRSYRAPRETEDYVSLSDTARHLYGVEDDDFEEVVDDVDEQPCTQYPSVPMDEEGLRLRGLALRRGARSGVEDSELMEEEAAEVWIQEALVSELRDRGRKGAQTKGAEAAAATAASITAEESGASSARLLAVIAEILRDRPALGRRSAKTPDELADEAEERLKRCRLVAEGPARCKSFTSNPGHFRSFMDAVAVAEFSISLGCLAGMPAVTVPEVRHAAAYPLGGPGGPGAPRTLYRLFFSLLWYTLTLWVSYGGKTLPRMRRWLRLIQRGGSTWQEILRRYLLMSRCGVQVRDTDLDLPLHEMSDDLAVVKYAVELGRGPYHTLGAAMHLRVLRVLCEDLVETPAVRTEMQARVDWVEGGGAKGASMREAERKKKADAALKKKKGGAAALAAAEADIPVPVENGVVNKSASATASAAISASKKATMAASIAAEAAAALEAAAAAAAAAEAAKREKKVPESTLAETTAGPAAMDVDGEAKDAADGGLQEGGADGAAEGGDEAAVPTGPKPYTGKPRGRKRGSGWSAGGRGPYRKGDLDPDYGEEGRSGSGVHDDAAKKEAEAEAESRRLGLRSDPLGVDRHGRRYWFLNSCWDLLYIEEPEGAGIGVVGSVAEMDAIMARLNKRGSRESALLYALNRVYLRVSTCLRSLQQVLQKQELQHSTDPNMLVPLPLAPGEASTFPASPLPGCLLAEGLPEGTVVVPMAPTSVTTAAALPEPPPDDGTLPVFPGRFRSLIPDESDAEDEEEEERILVREYLDSERAAKKARLEGSEPKLAHEEVDRLSRDAEEKLARTEEAYALAVAKRDLVRLTGRVERASEAGAACGCDSTAWRNKVEAIKDVPTLLKALLSIEAELGAMLDGQPEGATDEELQEVVREAEDYEQEFVLPAEPAADAEGLKQETENDGEQASGNAAHENGEAFLREGTDKQAGGASGAAASGVKKEEEGAGTAMASKNKVARRTAMAPPPVASANAASAEVSDAAEIASAATSMEAVHVSLAAPVAVSSSQEAVLEAITSSSVDAMQVDTAPCLPHADNAAAAAATSPVEAEAGLAMPELKEEAKEELLDVPGATPAAAQLQVKMVCQLEELDDSEAEDRQREKLDRSTQVAAALAAGANPALLAPRTRVALWRTKRERAVYLREVRRAQLSLAATPAVSYVSALLADRGEVVVAGWQLMKQAERLEVEAGKERRAAEAEAAAARLAAGGASAPAGMVPPGMASGGHGAMDLGSFSLLNGIAVEGICCACGAAAGDPSAMVSCEGQGCAATAHAECASNALSTAGIGSEANGSATPPSGWLCVVCSLNVSGGNMQRGRRAAAVAGVAALTASVGSRKLASQHAARAMLQENPSWE
ncbi:hypothetical protein CEUSTIGMA_g7654.t1 [Chlamydomonas eustigma]|uniref:PHD-type domain-containing protein n=1 Tax=Chlamydomonas eustigma TaxID=1157962 RepID=A0A250XAY9_9CHLO|nr:hypothetical protein CEUSTIGMA_g7654.t1 [Chlamydomonas eustigma]|eukprot:GAX80216.1 hypothetical protein CEUSTIGMA_g7654.t1 [Chlamydomonas eustigma]